MTILQSPPWKRFSLRTLFVLMTVCCLLLGMWSIYVNPFRLQAKSLAAVTRAQGEWLASPADGPIWQQWLVTTMLGDDAFFRVTFVDLAGRKVDDEILRSLSGLTHLRELKLDRTQITDEGLAALHAMPQLDILSLRYTAVTDRGVPILASLPKLGTLYLTGSQISDAAVTGLAKLPAIQELYIRWTQVTNEGAQRLRQSVPNCAVYHHALTAARQSP